MKVAICGPAASGKGTIARRFATEAMISYADLGLLFRLGAFGICSGRVASLERLLDLIQNKSVFYLWIEGEAKIIWDKEDITHLLVSQEVARQTALLASDPDQQEVLVSITDMVLHGLENVICDGRNAGTVILPDADHKFFITAQLEERARRRHQDVLRRGGNASFEEILEDIRSRDRLDAERASNPLVIPAGAVIIETDTLTVEESVRFMWTTIRNR